MAINLKTFPSGTAPYTGTDWQYMINNLLGAQMLMPGRQVLTDWTAVTTGVQIAQGTYFTHANSLYLTETSNESITGTISAGFNYIKLTVSGATLTASWITSLTGFSYNPAYQGWYNGSGEQLLLNGIYLDGSNYRRMVAQNYLTPHIWIVANYGQVINGKIIDTLGGDINTKNGNIETGSGKVNGVDISSPTGVDTNGGDIRTSDGNINVGDGLITGDVYGSVIMNAYGSSFVDWGVVGVRDGDSGPSHNYALIGKNVIGFVKTSGGISEFWPLSFDPTSEKVNIDTYGGDIDTGGGSIISYGGVIGTRGGDFVTGTGLVPGGNIRTYGGDIDTGGGDIDTGGGDIDTGGGDIDTGGGSLIGNLAVPDVFALVGSGLSISTVGVPSITALSSTLIAYIDSTNDELRTYSFSGSTWSQVGNSLSISGTAAASISAMDSQTIAFYDNATKDLRTYSFDGTNWSQVGNDLNLSTSSNGSLTALSSNTIALADDGTSTLRTYSFDGTNWSQVGNSISLGSLTQIPRITALKNDLVAIYIGTSIIDVIRIYYFNGTDWAIQGTGMQTGTSLLNITALVQTRIALVDWDNDELSIYDFNGDSLYRVGDILDISGIGQSSITAMSQTSIAFIDNALDSLRTYEFDYTDPYPPSPAF